MKSLMLDAGTVILWKEYGTFTKLWSKIRGKKLPYNRFTVITQKTELLTLGNILDLMEVYEPIRKYNKQESGKLTVITSGSIYYKDWKETVDTINIIRPNTLFATDTIDKCRYYKKVDWNEKLDEYIY